MEGSFRRRPGAGGRDAARAFLVPPRLAQDRAAQKPAPVDRGTNAEEADRPR